MISLPNDPSWFYKEWAQVYDFPMKNYKELSRRVIERKRVAFAVGGFCGWALYNSAHFSKGAFTFVFLYNFTSKDLRQTPSSDYAQRDSCSTTQIPSTDLLCSPGEGDTSIDACTSHLEVGGQLADEWCPSFHPVIPANSEQRRRRQHILLQGNSGTANSMPKGTECKRRYLFEETPFKITSDIGIWYPLSQAYS